MTPAQETRRFLASGDHDMLYSAWSGYDLVTKARKAERAMKHALIVEIRRRAKGRHLPSLRLDFDPCRLSLGKVGPMVRGLFPVREQQIVLSLFKKSLMFVTHDNIEQIITQMNWMGTAWQVANLYLGSLGLPGLDVYVKKSVKRINVAPANKLPWFIRTYRRAQSNESTSTRSTRVP